MVTRNSQEAAFKGGNGVAVSQGGGSYARPDLEAHRVSGQREGLDMSTSTSAGRILNIIAGSVDKLAGMAIQKSQAEAYLEGAAKAGQINSENELESDPFTRAWATSGYRDTMGRMAMAENDARLQTDMATMREASPEKYTEYLAQRRAELMPTLEGMTLQQRQSAFQNLLMTDRAAIRKHGVEHAKFIVETEDRSVQTAVGVKLQALTSAKADQESYNPATDDTYSTLQGAIVNNPKFTREHKSKLLTQAMQLALSNDHQRLYKMMQDDVIDLGDGTKGTMSSLVPFDDQVKLNSAFRESRNRTAAMRDMQFTDMIANVKADWDNPDTPPMTEGEMQAIVTKGVTEHGWSTDKQQSFTLDYLTSMQKKASLGGAAAAWAAGDSQKLLSLGLSDEEGHDAWMKTIARKMPMQQLIPTLMQIGIEQGRPAALKELGKQLAPALAQVGAADTLDPANAAAFAGTIRALDQAEVEGKVGLFAGIMSTYPDDMKAKMTYIREGLREGRQPETAYAEAVDRMARESQMTTQQRSALYESNAKDDVKVITEMEPRSALETLGMRLKSIISTDTANMLGLTPRRSWFENPERVAEAGASAKVAVMEELRAIGARHPFMDAESRKSTAFAAVRARTIETEGGPFILPRGSSIQRFFGVPANTPPDRVGLALNEFVKPSTEGGRVVFKVTEGQLTFRELNKEGRLVRDGIFNPKEVPAMVKSQRDRGVREYDAASGRGITVAGVTFNGNNTAGLEDKLVLGARQHLLEVGTIKFKPGMQYGEATKREFMTITDSAVKAAQLPVRTTKRGTPTAFNFYTELNLITNNRFTSMREYRPLLTALSGNDAAEAQAALHSAPVYTKASADDRARYDATINRIMQGL